MIILDAQLLKSYIVKHDKTQRELAEAMDVSLSRLNAKINETGGAEFSQGEIAFIKNRYNLSAEEINKIFFDIKVS